MGLPRPDLVVFLQLSPAEASLRGQFGTERYETDAFQKAVQQKFQHLVVDPTVNWKVSKYGAEMYLGLFSINP